jgi:hypothetical protein
MKRCLASIGRRSAKAMRTRRSVAATLVLAVLAQAHENVCAIAAMRDPSSGVNTPAEKDWAFSISIYTYVVPDDQTYVQPTITADRDWLHLEARYNYENLVTGSLWVGYNWRVGNELSLSVTPMLGGVFGRTTGIAPGAEATLDWWKLEFYGEGEYVFDTDDSSGSFLYTWSELSLSPMDWFRVGLVVQRTQAYHTDVDLQRGLLAGLSYKRVALRGYVFNPDEDSPTIVLAVGASF